MLDSGVRRGTDVPKALAPGAHFVLVGAARHGGACGGRRGERAVRAALAAPGNQRGPGTGGRRAGRECRPRVRGAW
nr:alpha-hydroxy-acid oxidizing protein [Paraburkholderia kururiensis]